LLRLLERSWGDKVRPQVVEQQAIKA
jgi:hypothetical protein